MSLLILLRHGQSEWNKKNIFTGWVDIPLSAEGIQEAFQAGDQISSYPIDYIFSSTLIRATMTALLAMSKHSSGKIPSMIHKDDLIEKWGVCHSEEASSTLLPMECAWQLNERMYGDLQGMNKQAMREKYGDDQIRIWRRSYDVAPPNGESLKDTAARSIPYFLNEIVPHLDLRQNVLVSAHGNSLRSIIMHLDKLTEEEVLNLEVPTGEPILYRYEKGQFYRQ